MKHLLAATALTCVALPFLAVPALASAPDNEEPIMFEAQSGDSTEAIKGTLSVPENRADPESRMIELSYVRFPATGPVKGPPIVYLSGGPGGSGIGTAKGRRFPLFMEMRRHADVIAFDQRGTGASTALPFCTSSEDGGETAPMSDDEFANAWKRATDECADIWAAEGVDLAGYTTLESVADLSDLRKHLGANTISLWGISYGSHLALAAIGNIPDELDRVIIASAEGLDQTVKLPVRTNAYFQRLQDAVNATPTAKALYPDIIGLINRVNTRLNTTPMTVPLPQEDGSTLNFQLQRRHVQQFAGGMIADPDSAAIMLKMYAELDAGKTGLITVMLQRFYNAGAPIGMRAMTMAMDRASGISPARLSAFERQKDNSPIGGYLNFPMPQILSQQTQLDLGEEFRGGPFADTPVLLLTGTLDGRTYPEGQSEAVAGLSNVQQVVVTHAGHNLFMTSPEVAKVMHRFMRAETLESKTVDLPVPDLSQIPDLR